MALSDYAHWNEEAVSVWFQEEGRFGESFESDPYDDYEYEWEYG